MNVHFSPENFAGHPITFCIYASKSKFGKGVGTNLSNSYTKHTIVLLICPFLSIIVSFIGFGAKLISMIFTLELSVLKIKILNYLFIFNEIKGKETPISMVTFFFKKIKYSFFF